MVAAPTSRNKLICSPLAGSTLAVATEGPPKTRLVCSTLPIVNNPGEWLHNQVPISDFSWALSATPTCSPTISPSRKTLIFGIELTPY